jgi:hypothetical protein
MPGRLKIDDPNEPAAPPLGVGLLLIFVVVLASMLYSSLGGMLTGMTVNDNSKVVASPEGSDPVDQVARLWELRQAGALSDEEYERLKARTIDGA